LAAVFYGLYLLPGLFLLAWKTGEWRLGRFFRSRHLLLAFALGCSAHVVGALIQKYLHLPYRSPVVFFCLAAGYLLMVAAATLFPVEAVLEREPPSQEKPWEQALADLLLLLALFLGWEMTLRGRGSSLNLAGDGFPHLINFLGTLKDGPFPDGLPFYTTFILNVHPMAFHALLAGLKTLTPGILHIDMFRYFSVLMVPVFVGSMMGFFSWLGRSRLAGALITLAALFVSGGGLSLGIPIIFFPWYWSVAWCLAAAVFYLLLRGELRSRALTFWAGWMLGIGTLMHPVFAFRMGAIFAFFLPLEIIRRWIVRQPIAALFPLAALFAAGVLLPVGAWLLPPVLKYGWEETYSYRYILENFSAVAPEGVRYISGLKEARYSPADLWRWTWKNAGLLPSLLAPLGMALAFRDARRPLVSLLAAWLIAMASAVLFGYLPNSYRYFEFFFFALLAAASVGAGFLCRLSFPWRVPVISALLCLSFFSIRQEFLPKYRRALSLYGRTSLTPKDIAQAEKRAEDYFKAKDAGVLDRSYGNYPGYLWSRQKKIWDIYVRNRTQKGEKL
jgi:hypothetical protein